LRELRRRNQPWALSLLAQGLGDDWAAVRWISATSLAGRREPLLTSRLRESLQSDDPRLRSAAIDALIERDDLVPSDELAALLQDPHLAVRHAAARALGRRGSASHLAELGRVALDRVEEVAARSAAVEAGVSILAHAQVSAPQWHEVLCALAADPSPVMRAWAARGVGDLKLISCEAQLWPLLRDSDLGVRYRAVQGLALVGQRESLDQLRVLRNNRRRVFGKTLASRVRLAMVRIWWRAGVTSVKGRLAALAQFRRGRNP
jgi:HEAT repeat protein